MELMVPIVKLQFMWYVDFLNLIDTFPFRNYGSNQTASDWLIFSNAIIWFFVPVSKDCIWCFSLNFNFHSIFKIFADNILIGIPRDDPIMAPSLSKVIFQPWNRSIYRVGERRYILVRQLKLKALNFLSVIELKYLGSQLSLRDYRY